MLAGMPISAAGKLEKYYSGKGCIILNSGHCLRPANNSLLILGKLKFILKLPSFLILNYFDSQT